ncbi:hypothetical protein QA311_11105 [Glaesserella parasuis]|nr:hypothetical protein [Glaesserella parasuis]
MIDIPSAQLPSSSGINGLEVLRADGFCGFFAETPSFCQSQLALNPRQPRSIEIAMAC